MTEPEPTLSFSGSAAGMRSDYCGLLRADDIGRTVSVAGWVDRRREHGEHLAFVDLRDRTGVVQCVVDGAHDLRSEYVVRITGAGARARPEGTRNAGLATGDVEIGDCEVEILSTAEPIPFPIDDRRDVDETLRLRHRYIDLRRARMQRNLLGRSTINAALRRSMERQGFVEIETPMLIASTPEGARDFVVPSRLAPGAFYALPQSPQLFKQLAMVGGLDRYYQIARCLRDEDLRADRQFEFMQLDLEASFVGQDEVLAFVSDAIAEATVAVTGTAPGCDRADHLARGAGALRLRQARPALRHGADRAHRGVRRHGLQRVQGSLRQGHPGARGRGAGPEPARCAHGLRQAVGRQGAGLDEGRGRRRAVVAGRQVPVRWRAGRAPRGDGGDPGGPAAARRGRAARGVARPRAVAPRAGAPTGQRRRVPLRVGRRLPAVRGAGRRREPRAGPPSLHHGAPRRRGAPRRGIRAPRCSRCARRPTTWS